MTILQSQKLMNEIIRATEHIQKEFPEHYRYLSETPLFLPCKENSISELDFEHYLELESLLMQLKTFKKAASMNQNL